MTRKLRSRKFSRKRRRSNRVGGTGDVSLFNPSNTSAFSPLLNATSTLTPQIHNFTNNSFPSVYPQVSDYKSDLVPIQHDENIYENILPIDLNEVSKEYPFGKRTDINRIYNTLKGIITPDEKSFLAAYTNSNYWGVSDSIRSYFSGRKETVSEYEAAMVSEIDNIFQKVPPLIEPLKVFKGVKNFDHIWNHTQFYTSTTSVRNKALYFARDAAGKCGRKYILEIDIMPGTHILPIYELSHHPTQDEIILPRDGKVTFVSHTLFNEDREKKIKNNYWYGVDNGMTWSCPESPYGELFKDFDYVKQNENEYEVIRLKFEQGHPNPMIQVPNENPNQKPNFDEWWDDHVYKIRQDAKYDEDPWYDQWKKKTAEKKENERWNKLGYLGRLKETIYNKIN
jgi:hypothetical protein